jgi:hypothetical protein
MTLLTHTYDEIEFFGKQRLDSQNNGAAPLAWGSATNLTSFVRPFHLSFFHVSVVSFQVQSHRQPKPAHRSHTSSSSSIGLSRVRRRTIAQHARTAPHANNCCYRLPLHYPLQRRCCCVIIRQTPSTTTRLTVHTVPRRASRHL